MSVDVTAIVLAAGESSRMGRPKPLLPLGDGTFLSQLLADLEASRVTRTLLVLGYHPEVILEAMPVVVPLAVTNPDYQNGQLSSLHVGLHAVGEGPDAVLMCLADHPFIGREVIDLVIDGFERTGLPIVVPTFEGRRGHPTLFARSLFRELLDAPLDQGARVVVRAHAPELLELPTTNRGILADVDTPEQYATWLAWWELRQRQG